MDDLIFASASSIADAIRDKRVSATEVVEAHLRRIKEVNPKRFRPLCSWWQRGPWRRPAEPTKRSP